MQLHLDKKHRVLCNIPSIMPVRYNVVLFTVNVYQAATRRKCEWILFRYMMKDLLIIA